MVSSSSDETVINPGARLPAIAPEAPTSGEQCGDHALAVGTRVSEFEILTVIGVGGFGIVYLARDHSLGRNVALKEYMPSSLASRNGGITVSAKSDRYAQTFTIGLRSFMSEARTLALFDHPALVKVHRFWEANGTAYMVMPFYEGPTLGQALRDMTSPPSEEWLTALLIPLMEALQLIHQENWYHRDIAPDNILLVKGSRPVLLDFGAARLVIGDLAKSLTVILKPGYAPIEQYADDPTVRQGAWTDIYALAAVVHYAITGKAPVASVGRVIADTIIPLERSASGRYSQGFLRGLDRAMAVKPEDRPQSIDELRSLLALGDHPHDHHASIRSGMATPTAPAREGRGAKRLIVGLVAATLLLGVGALFLLQRGVETAHPSAALANASVAVDAPTAGTPSTSVSASAGSSGQAVSKGAQHITQPFSPVDVLARLFDRRNPDNVVDVGLDQSRVKIGRDQFRFRIKSTQPGYLYLMMVGTKGDHVMIFPNAADRDNKISGAKEVRFPRAGWDMTADGPPGTDEFLAMVSDNPRDFAGAGITKAGPFREFPLAKMSKLFESSTDAVSIAAGKPVCASSGKCSAAYGAARFSIEETN